MAPTNRHPTTRNAKHFRYLGALLAPCSERFLIFPFDATTSRMLNFTTKVVGLFVVPSSRPYIFTKILVRLAKDLSTPNTSQHPRPITSITQTFFASSFTLTPPTMFLDMLAMAQGPFLRAFQHSCPRLGVNGRSLEENEESVGIHHENAGHCMRMWEMSGKATRGVIAVEGGQGGAEPLTMPIDPPTQRHSNK